MKQEIRWGLLVIGISVCLLSPLLPFGLDFTDAGYSTTLAWLQVTHPQAADWTINSFGTPLLAGLWFKATGWDSLLGFRIFWMFWIILGMLAAYTALITVYSPRSAALTLIPTLFLAMFNSEEVLIPEYHNFPTVLCLACIALLLLGIQQTRYSTAWITLSGCVAGLMIFARIPLIALLIVLYGMLLFFAWWQNPVRQLFLRSALVFTIGLGIGIFVSLLILFNSGYSLEWIMELSAHSQNANTRLTKTYGAALGYYPLWLSTVIRYGKILGMGCAALVAAFVWRLFWPAMPKGKPLMERFAQIVVLTAVAIVIIIVVRSGDSRFLGFHYGPITSLLLGTPIFLVALRLIVEYRSLPIEKLLLWGCALALFITASLGGSGVWVSTFRHGVWLILPVALLESGGAIERWFDTLWLRRVLIVGAITLGCALRWYMPYRDKPVPELTATFTTPPLAGIRSSDGRVQALEGVLSELGRRNIQANDTVMVYPDGALIYYLTKTIPWWRDPWIGMQWTSKEDLVNFTGHLPQQTLAGRRVLPRYVVRLKFDPNAVTSLDSETPTRMFDFGDAGIIDTTGARLYYGFLEQPASHFLDSLFRHNGYSIVWENKGFVILQRPR